MNGSFIVRVQYDSWELPGRIGVLDQNSCFGNHCCFRTTSSSSAAHGAIGTAASVPPPPPPLSAPYTGAIQRTSVPDNAQPRACSKTARLHAQKHDKRRCPIPRTQADALRCSTIPQSHGRCEPQTQSQAGLCEPCTTHISAYWAISSPNTGRFPLVPRYIDEPHWQRPRVVLAAFSVVKPPTCRWALPKSSIAASQLPAAFCAI